MGDRSENCRLESSSDRAKPRFGRVVISGLVLGIITVAKPVQSAPPRTPETRVTASPKPVEEKSKSGEAKSKSSEERSPQLAPMRRRGGSSPGAPRLERATSDGKRGSAGEVEGGTGAPRPQRVASASPASGAAKPPCVRGAVLFERGFGGDSEAVVLTRCDGRANSTAVEQLSILVRPMNVARPSALASRIRRAAHREWLPGVKRIHEGLVTRLQAVADRFRAQKITLVSGYRPTSLGSFHQSARALDLHVEGVSNEALVEYCRSLPDTGCGYYPNSSFVHIDVRPAGTGHVYWIDASGPGEPARYVASWPPKDSAANASGIAPPDPAAPLDEHTHAGAARPPLGGNDAKIDARTTAPWWGGEGPENGLPP
jgi:peptidase M15-like protein